MQTTADDQPKLSPAYIEPEDIARRARRQVDHLIANFGRDRGPGCWAGAMLDALKAIESCAIVTRQQMDSCPASARLFDRLIDLNSDLYRIVEEGRGYTNPSHLAAIRDKVRV